MTEPNEWQSDFALACASGDAEDMRRAFVLALSRTAARATADICDRPSCKTCRWVRAEARLVAALADVLASPLTAPLTMHADAGTVDVAYRFPIAKVPR